MLERFGDRPDWLEHPPKAFTLYGPFEGGRRPILGLICEKEGGFLSISLSNPLDPSELAASAGFSSPVERREDCRGPCGRRIASDSNRNPTGRDRRI